MIHIIANRINKARLNRKIISFYIGIWHDRLVSQTKRKYAYNQVWRNINNVLSFYCKTFNDNQIKNPTLSAWKSREWKEIPYKNWHFAVIIQLDLFGRNMAIVQDCVHDKDYHNDTMQTEPFKMDNPDDMSHLVDWKEHRLNVIIAESIRKSIKKLL